MGITSFVSKEGQNLNFALPSEAILAVERETDAAATRPREKQAEKDEFAMDSCEMEPSDSDKWRWRGDLAESARNHELAIEAYRKAIQVDPQNDIAHTELGELLQRMGKLQEAIAEYRRPPAQHLAPLDLIFAWPMRSKSKGVWMKLLLSIVRSLDSRLIGRMHILTWGTRSLPRETLTRRYLKWKKRCGYGRRTPMHTPVFAKLSVRRATLTAHSPNVAAH